MNNYLIIGGSSGIGRAIVKQLNEGNNYLFLASRTAGNVSGENINFQSVDVTESFELELPEKLDGLIYCPGSINLKPFHRLKTEAFLEDFKINYLGAVKVIQQALKALKKSENASIVLFSTVAVQTGLNFRTSVAPSLTGTSLSSRLLSSEEKVKANADRHPLKSIGRAEDMTHTARVLLGKESRWMTGQVIAVDGGMSNLR